jgi:thymidylate kinase
MSDMINSSSKAIKRGSFIVFEGLDRSGKSTQLNNLFNHHHATVTGNLIKYNFPSTPSTLTLHHY